MLRLFLASMVSSLLSPSDLLNLDATALSKHLQDGDCSPVDVMTACLDRIDSINSKYNSIINLRNRDELLLEAKSIHAASRNNVNNKGWLTGIPIAIKDLSNVKGIPTTMGGSPLFDATIPATISDPFVQRIVDSGAIIIGKTNTPESGLGSHTYNTLWGITYNTYDRTKSAGGSSGGAAVALATNMLWVTDGSDMMGSLRNPAGWNNIYSIRPTAGMLEYDIIDRNPLKYPISTVGPMARSVRDLAMFLEVMAGKDKFTAPDWAKADYIADEKKKLNKTTFRILWLGDWAGCYPVEDGILSTCYDSLSTAFATIPNVKIIDGSSSSIFPGEKLWTAWTTIRSAVVASTAITNHGKDRLFNGSGVREELIWEIQRGLDISDEDVKVAGSVANEFSETLNKLIFNTYDAIALPTAQVWPFPAEWKYPKEINGIKMDTYHRWMEIVIPVSLAGLPCVTVPSSMSQQSTTTRCMGIQIAGPRGSDEKLLEVAQLYHTART